MLYRLRSTREHNTYLINVYVGAKPSRYQQKRSFARVQRPWLGQVTVRNHDRSPGTSGCSAHHGCSLAAHNHTVYDVRRGRTAARQLKAVAPDKRRSHAKTPGIHATVATNDVEMYL